MSELYISLLNTPSPVLVKHLMTNYFPEVDADCPIQSIIEHESFDQSPWLFLTDQETVVGVVETHSIRTVIEAGYFLESTNISALQMYPVDYTSTNTDINDIEPLFSSTQPVLLVQNDDGQVVGYIDQTYPDRMKDRFFLSYDAQQSLRNLPWIEELFTISSSLNTPIYAIGGFVRDWLMGNISEDLDLAVEGDVLSVANALAERYGGTVQQFQHFGGVHWTTATGYTIDLTKCRSEVYSTIGALPSVVTSHVAKDLQRRDFNINAMAISLDADTFGLLLDPFDGLAGLKTQSFHTLHGLSFLQDPTRIFRASRYAARFNFAPSSKTLAQIHGALSTIRVGTDLTWTRVGIEMDKILREPNPNLCFDLLKRWGVLQKWMPFWTDCNFPLQCLSTTHTVDDRQMMWWMILSLRILIHTRQICKDSSD